MSDNIMYSKYLMFVDDTNVKVQKRTKVYKIISTHDDAFLGRICWINTWRRYAYQPECNINMSVECLTDIILFIDTLMNNRNNRDNI